MKWSVVCVYRLTREASTSIVFSTAALFLSLSINTHIRFIKFNNGDNKIIIIITNIIIIITNIIIIITNIIITRGYINSLAGADLPYA